MTAAFVERKTIAELTAKMLLEVEAVRFFDTKPFTFTSGWASPVYTDCRRLISFPHVRRTLMEFGEATLARDAGFERFDAVAGGETAGIPFAAWMADRLALPMLYVRKAPKGFGRNAQIEGHLAPGARVLLVEDMTTDGRSKVNFCQALRAAGATVDHAFVVFFYDIFPAGRKILAAIGHHHARAGDVVGRAGGGARQRPLSGGQARRHRILHARPGVMVQGAWRRRRGVGIAMPHLKAGITSLPRRRIDFSTCVLGHAADLVVAAEDVVADQLLALFELAPHRLGRCRRGRGHCRC